jgi:hypothetical protein
VWVPCEHLQVYYRGYGSQDDGDYYDDDDYYGYGGFRHDDRDDPTLFHNTEQEELFYKKSEEDPWPPGPDKRTCTGPEALQWSPACCYHHPKHVGGHS